MQARVTHILRTGDDDDGGGANNAQVTDNYRLVFLLDAVLHDRLAVALSLTGRLLQLFYYNSNYSYNHNYSGTE